MRRLRTPSALVVVSRPDDVGTIRQLTTIEVSTRWAVVRLIVGEKSADHAKAFVDHAAAELPRIGISPTGMTTDNVPELTGGAFKQHPADLGIDRHRIG